MSGSTERAVDSSEEHPNCPGCGKKLTFNANQPWMCECGYMELNHGCGVDAKFEIEAKECRR